MLPYVLEYSKDNILKSSQDTLKTKVSWKNYVFLSITLELCWNMMKYT